MIKNRDGKIIKKGRAQNALLEKLYGTLLGRFFLKLLTAPVISRIVGAFMDSPLSEPIIKPFIRAGGIDTSQYIMTGIKCFNDFFTRSIKSGARRVDMDSMNLISPCDAKLTVYKICRKSVFKIKNSCYRISDLLQNDTLAAKYNNGLCLIFRLEVDDYHRYCYFDNGRKTDNIFIPGELHTVNPIALEHYNIYKRNSREYTLLHTKNFGDAVQCEVGAMLVGRIENHHQVYSFRRGEEKGLFLYGGSTVILLLEAGRAVIDSDIMRNSADGFETVVKYGEKIGRKIAKSL